MGPVYAYANAMRTVSVLFYSLQGVSIPAPHSPITFVRLRWKKTRDRISTRFTPHLRKQFPLPSRGRGLTIGICWCCEELRANRRQSRCCNRGRTPKMPILASAGVKAGARGLEDWPPSRSPVRAGSQNIRGTHNSFAGGQDP